MTVLIFDSGIGGLSVLREARVLFPEHSLVYVADDAAFPYGDWEEDALKARMAKVFDLLFSKYNPDVSVIACNTASTLAIHHLREVFPDHQFVGTVPAIKPAAERTQSGLVSVLATPGTVKRQYTRDLIDQWARHCEVNLVGSTELARLAEEYLRGGFVEEQAVLDEISPCFVTRGDRRTDIVVLACTHYPFLVNRMRKMAPWPVDWIDTSEAIARRTLSLLQSLGKCALTNRAANADASEITVSDCEPDVALVTSGTLDFSSVRLFKGFGLEPGELPV